MTALGLRMLIAAQIADYATFVIMIARHGLSAELNPLVATMAQDHGLMLLTAAKVSAVVLVAATFLVVGRTRPRLAAAVLAFAAVTGGIGALSNVATI
jgi:hypothetical protein